MSFLRKRPDYPELVRLTLLPVLIGLAAGVAGAMVAESYLAADALPPPQPIRIGRTISSVEAPLPEIEVARRLRGIDLPLYPRKASTGDVVDRARDASEIVGYAAVLTSDGWLATHRDALDVPVSVALEGRLLEPTTRIEDPRTGVVFLKIDASALDVSGFADTETLPRGTALFAAGEARLFAATAFAGIGLAPGKIPSGSLRASDRFSRLFRLDRALGDRALGGAVLTSGGALAGIVAPGQDGADAFVPMHLIRPVLVSVFRGQVPARALLGAHYLQLEDAVFSGVPVGDGVGARLTSSRALGLPAVRPGSAAARAGLLEGDIVLRIDDVDIAAGRDLAEVLASYGPGAKARFDILRGSERRTLEVAFD